MNTGSGTRLPDAACDATGKGLLLEDHAAGKHEIGGVATQLSGAGKGVRGIKLEPDDELLGFVQLTRPSDCLRVKNDNDSVLSFGQTKYQVSSRGGRGIKTSSRTGFVEILQPEIQLVDWTELGGVSE